MLTKLSRRARRAVFNYYAALTISAGIVGPTLGGPRSHAGSQIVRIQRRELIDGRWHPGEIVAAGRDQAAVVVVELDPVAVARGDCPILPN